MKQCPDEEKFKVNRMVFTINQFNMTLRDGQSLLHLACNAETPVDDFHTNDICKYVLTLTSSYNIKICFLYKSFLLAN